MATSQKQENTTSNGGPVNEESQLSKDYVAYLTHLTSSWSSCSASKALDKDLINYLVNRFYRCSTVLKVRILMSLLYLPPQLVHECRVPLSYLLNDCETEADDWVRKLSRLLQPYVVTGHIDIREVDTEVAYRCMKYLDETKDSNLQYRLKPPLEYSRVFDVTEDVWPPHERSHGRDSHGTDSHGTDSHGGDSHGGHGGGSSYNTSGNSSDGFQAYFDSLPTAKIENRHFTAAGDFNVFMKDVEQHGFASITREIRNIEDQQNRRRLSSTTLTRR